MVALGSDHTCSCAWLLAFALKCYFALCSAKDGVRSRRALVRPGGKRVGFSLIRASTRSFRCGGRISPPPPRTVCAFSIFRVLSQLCGSVCVFVCLCVTSPNGVYPSGVCVYVCARDFVTCTRNCPEVLSVCFTRPATHFPS